MHRQIVCVDGKKHIRDFHNPQPECWTSLNANNADFRDYGDRITLANLGIFSVNRASHRYLRALQALREQEIANAYAYLGLDRRATYRTVAQEVQDAGLVPDGCWVRSTGAYANRRDWHDRETITTAARYRVAEQQMREVAEDHVVTAVFSLGA